MIFREILLPAVLAPAFAAALVIWPALLWRRERGVVVRTGGTAVAAAFLAAFVALTGWPRIPPVEATQRLFFAVALAGLLSWFANFAPIRRRVEVGIGALLLLLALPMILASRIEHAWSSGEALARVGGFAVLGLALTLAVAEPWRRHQLHTGDPAWRHRDWLTTAIRLTVLGGVAAALGFGESARLAQLQGAAVCGAVVVEIARFRRPIWKPADAWAWVVPSYGLMLCGLYYAELGTLPFGLLAAALILLAATDEERSWWMRLLPLPPLIAAVAVTATRYLGQDSGLEPYY